MKPAALESYKEVTISDIEKKLELLMKAKGISFEEVTPPVKNPNYRTLQALQRIDAKLALVLQTENLAESEAAAIKEPAAEPETVQPADETIPGEEVIAQEPEPEAAQPVAKPDRKTKTK